MAFVSDATNLVNPVNTTIIDGQDVGAIIDDDALVLLTDPKITYLETTSNAVTVTIEP